MTMTVYPLLNHQVQCGHSALETDAVHISAVEPSQTLNTAIVIEIVWSIEDEQRHGQVQREGQTPLEAKSVTSLQNRNAMLSYGRLSRREPQELQYHRRSDQRGPT